MARRARDPYTAIVEFFMNSSVAEAGQALATAQAIMRARAATQKAQPGQVRVARKPRSTPPQQPPAKTIISADAAKALVDATPIPVHDPVIRTKGGTPAPRRRAAVSSKAAPAVAAFPPQGEPGE